MRLIQKFFLLGLFLGLLVQCGKKISISMVTSTSADSGLPFDALQGKEWRAEPKAEYVKLHIYSDEVLPLSKVEATPCQGKFKESVYVFINFDEFFRSTKAGDSSAIVTYDPPVNARSVTLNFNKNTALCLSSLNLYDEKGKKYKTILPKFVEADVTASETGSPKSSYDVMNLFDSRYEYAYASDKGAIGVEFKFKFKEDVKIESIRIWNGYQRSDIHCVDNGRVKEFQITGDDGYSEKISLNDDLGSQTIPLPKKFKGKNINFKVTDFFKGRNAKGIVISELRFFDGDHWFLPNPFPTTKSIASANSMNFQKSGLIEMLNRSIEGGDSVATVMTPAPVEGQDGQIDLYENEDATADSSESSTEREHSNWIFRFRSDGSMFLEGSTTRNSYDESGMVAQYSRFYAIGNYEVKETSENRMVVRIFGFLRNSKGTENVIYGEGDCNGCGRDCNKLGSGADPDSSEKIFQEYLEITPSRGKFIIKNQKKTQNLDFDSLELGIY